MTTVRPKVAGVDIFPDFAMVDIVDPVSELNNALQPPAAYAAYGWSRDEPPPRNYENWTKRYTSLWLHYLDEQRAAMTPALSYRNAGAGDPSLVTGIPSWKIDGSNPEYGYACLNAGEPIRFRVSPPVGGGKLELLVFKWFNNGADSVPGIAAGVVDPHFVLATTAPGYASFFSESRTVVGGTWRVLTYGPLAVPITIPGYGYVLITVIGANVGDHIALVGCGFSGPDEF